jgi:hypothetical protein
LKTRTLSYVVIVLTVAVTGLIGYQQWGTPPSAGEGAGPGAFDSSAAHEEFTASPAATASTAALPGFARVSATQPQRPLTVAEKEQVAKAMDDFRQRLETIDLKAKLSVRLNAFYEPNPASTRIIWKLPENTEPRADAPVTFSPVVNDNKGSTFMIATALSEVLKSHDSNSPASSEANDRQTERIAAASASLSEVLKSFESGSPAWREAREQGEKIMRESSTLKGYFPLAMGTKLKRKTVSSPETILPGGTGASVKESITITTANDVLKIHEKPLPKDERTRNDP